LIYASRYAPQHGYYHGGGGGPIVAGALLGLGLGAVIAGAIAPPVVYAPPPVVYEAPPMIYAPSPGYYYGRW